MRFENMEKFYKKFYKVAPAFLAGMQLLTCCALPENIPGSNIKEQDISSQTSAMGTNDHEETADVLSQVVTLCNLQRTSEGLGTLTMNSELNTVAATRAQEITTCFSHSRPDGSTCFDLMDSYGVTYHAAGENIAAGQTTAEEVVTGWMNSPEHRANIMHGEFSHAGVGCAYANDEYEIYWVIIFTD